MFVFYVVAKDIMGLLHPAMLQSKLEKHILIKYALFSK